MGLMLMISSCAIIYKAFLKLKRWETWYTYKDQDRMNKEAEHVSQWLAWTGFAMYSVQAVVRCMGARKVQCTTLSHASVVSVICLVYLLVLGVAAVEEHEWSWKAEPIAAIVLVAL